MDILIALRPDADQAAFVARAAAAGIEIERIEGLPRHFRASWTDMDSFPLRNAPEVLDMVNGDERIGAPQVTQGLSIGSAPGLIDGDSWALARIVRRRAPWDTMRIRTPVATSYQSARDGSGVDIYILDTGVDLDHPSFGGRAATVYEIVSSGGLGDDQGHGTLCASVAAGDEVGVARGALLWSIKITDETGATTNSAFSTCLGQMNSHYAGRSATGRPAVCTCSWVFPTTLYIDSVIAAAVDAGIVMIGAAGNAMLDLATTGSYPAEMADVLCVGGAGPADTPFYKGYAGTNYGDVEVDILAPAYQVKCAQAYTLDVGRGYFFKDGTSLAAPLAAGVVACILEGHSRLADRAAVQAVIAHLLATATTGKFRAAPEFGIGDLPDRLLYLNPTQTAPETIPPLASITALTVTPTGGETAQIDLTATDGATIYLYVSNSATPPSDADLKAGTGAVWSTNFVNPGAFTGPSGLTASTNYWCHALPSKAGTDGSVVTDAFTTEAADVTAPSLTSPGATVLDTTSADMTVTTDEGRGTLWAIASTVNSAPSAAQIKLGQDGSGTTTNVKFAAGGGAGVNVGATGVQTITATGLTEVPHYGFFYQEDPTGNGSSVVATGAFTPADVTGPVLSSAEGTVSGSYGGTGTVNTDTGEGLLSSVATKSSTTPTATQIIAGQDHTGAGVPTGAKDLANTVSASGPQAVAFSDLDGASSYWTHFAQTDEATNQSNAITASASFTTAAAAVPSAMSAPSLAVDSSTQITATLAADPARNGADITSYDLRYSTDEASWTTVTGVTSPHAITGLSAATLYYVQTRAVNSVGAGAWSTSASATTSAGGYDPVADLFGASELGGVYDVTDISTLWQDTAGTTQVTAAGQSVQRVDDISGNGNNWTSATNPPTYRVDGNGKGYLEFDGANDVLNGSVDIEPGAGWDIAVGFEPVAADALLGGWQVATSNPWLFAAQSGSINTDLDGSGAVFGNAYFDAGSAFSGNRGDAYTAYQAANTVIINGTASLAFVVKFGYYSATFTSFPHLYRWVVRQGTMDATQRSNLDGWLAVAR